MKTPTLNLLLVAFIVLLSSCDKEIVIGTDAEPESPIELRCCTDDIDDILGNENFNDLFGDFQTGLIEPGLALIDGLDEEYLDEIFGQFDACIANGGDPLECIEGISELFFVKNYIEDFNDFLLDSLRGDYSGLTDEEFYELLGTALLGNVVDEETRDLPCFTKYQQDIIQAGFNLASNAARGNRILTAVNLIKDLSMARLRFCHCMFNNYGTKC